MDATVAAIIAVIGAITAPVVTYLVTARRFSGKIQTTDASELWDEARDIREDYRTRLSDCNARIKHLEEENGELRNKNYELTISIRSFEFQVRTLKQQLAEAVERGKNGT